MQQKKSSGAVSPQSGYAPVQLEAQGQTAVHRRQSDCMQQQTSSRAVSNQIRHAPVRLEAATTESREARVRHVPFDTTHIDLEQPSLSKTSSRPSSSVKKERDIAAAERWQCSFNPNRACTRLVGSPRSDSSYVKAKRDFTAAEEQ